MLCRRLEDYKWLSLDQFQDDVHMIPWKKLPTFRKTLHVEEGANAHGITRMKIHFHEQRKVRGHEHRLMSEKTENEDD